MVVSHPKLFIQSQESDDEIEEDVEDATSAAESEELSDHLNSPTLELPGPVDDNNDEDNDETSDNLKPDGAPDLRGAYWDFVHDMHKKLKKECPELSGREILKRAREMRLYCNKLS